MNQNILILTAASLGFFHTLLGPDHYVPFIALSKAKNWDVNKTIGITVLCGIGHVLGSIALGFAGVFLGIALENLEIIESYRGAVASYLLIGFGLIYMIYGLRKGYKTKTHQHVHFHVDGTVHSHTHIHSNAHSHIHAESQKQSITPWVLFVIFIFGPCEVLIPLLMYPAAQNNYGLLIWTTVVFGVVTIATMTFIVAFVLLGFRFVQFKRFEKYSHALAGALILICGVAVQFLGV